MAIKERFFLIGDQWNVIHYPEKPNGFAVFIYGDVEQFVQSNTSSWHQNPALNNYIEKLKAAGYTVVNSHLQGRNWGSEEACQFALRLYDEVQKKEILNKRIHLIAIGMGALVAAKIVPQYEDLYRSIVMIDPCLNFTNYFHNEKTNRFFYKRLVNELKTAYRINEEELNKTVSVMNVRYYQAIPIPLKIFHRLNKTPYSLEEHIRPYEALCNSSGNQIELAIFLNKKRFDQLSIPTINFFQSNETLL